MRIFPSEERTPLVMGGSYDPPPQSSSSSRQAPSSSPGRPLPPPPPPTTTTTTTTTDAVRNARLTVIQEAVPTTWGGGGAATNVPSTNMWARVLSTILLLPQVFAVLLLLSLHPSENCNLDDRSMTLRTWITGDALQKSLQLFLVWFPVVCQRRGLHLSRRQLRTMRFVMLWNDVFAILWLVQGSTLFSGSGNDVCRDVSAPHVYKLGLGLLIMSMLSMSLPLILCAAMVPLVCFCLPCFIRVILAARSTRPKGASKEKLATLPSSVYEPGSLPGTDAQTQPSCAICLATYSTGEEVRCLPCDPRHHFHRECVDDWLMLNCSCPICRKGVFDAAEPGGGGGPDVEQGLLEGEGGGGS
jgi:hypothetical protein